MATTIKTNTSTSPWNFVPVAFKDILIDVLEKAGLEENFANARPRTDDMARVIRKLDQAGYHKDASRLERNMPNMYFV